MRMRVRRQDTRNVAAVQDRSAEVVERASRFARIEPLTATRDLHITTIEQTE